MPNLINLVHKVINPTRHACNIKHMKAYQRILIEIICLAIFAMNLAHAAVYVRTGVERAEQYAQIELTADDAIQVDAYQFNGSDHADKDLVKLNLANHLEANPPIPLTNTLLAQAKQEPNVVYRLGAIQNVYTPLIKPPKLIPN